MVQVGSKFGLSGFGLTQIWVISMSGSVQFDYSELSGRVRSGIVTSRQLLSIGSGIVQISKFTFNMNVFRSTGMVEVIVVVVRSDEFLYNISFLLLL